MKYPIFLLFTWAVLFPPGATEAAEDSERVYFLHALKSKQEGNFLEAENLFRKAIEFEPQNADFHFELGNLYAEREDFPSARFEYEQAVMIAPTHLAAHYNLGLVYSEIGWTGEARGQFRRVLELDPQNVRARIQIGRTYAEEGFFDDARQAFEEAREMDPLSPEPADALEELARKEEEAKLRSTSQLEQSFDRSRNSFDLLSSGRDPE